MEKAKTIIAITSVFIFLFSYENLSGSKDHLVMSNSDQISSNYVQTGAESVPAASNSTQEKPKSIQKSSKSVPVNKSKDSGIINIGKQAWAVANLNVSTFRNGDTIPEAKTNEEWVEAGSLGRPAWCYYNNDPSTGQKYGKLYNWFAVNDPRELAPEGWSLASAADWADLAYSLGGPEVAGIKLKSTEVWPDGNNVSGFTGLPGGYRIENGLFKNFGTIAAWWSTTEGNSTGAVDFYLSRSNSLESSSDSMQRGKSVRCLRK